MADELSDAFEKLAKVIERASLGGDLTGVKEAWIKADNEFVKAAKKRLDAWKETYVRAEIEDMISEGVLPTPLGALTLSEIEPTPIMHNAKYIPTKCDHEDPDNSGCCIKCQLISEKWILDDAEDHPIIVESAP